MQSCASQKNWAEESGLFMKIEDSLVDMSQRKVMSFPSSDVYSHTDLQLPSINCYFILIEAVALNSKGNFYCAWRKWNDVWHILPSKREKYQSQHWTLDPLSPLMLWFHCAYFLTSFLCWLCVYMCTHTNTHAHTCTDIYFSMCFLFQIYLNTLHLHFAILNSGCKESNRWRKIWD